MFPKLRTQEVRGANFVPLPCSIDTGARSPRAQSRSEGSTPLSRKHQACATFCALAGLKDYTVGGGCMDQMPIYRVNAMPADIQTLIDMAQRIFDIDLGYKITDLDNRRVLTRDSHVVELYAASGGVWAADEAQLFNPSLRPKLPTET